MGIQYAFKRQMCTQCACFPLLQAHIFACQHGCMNTLLQEYTAAWTQSGMDTPLHANTADTVLHWHTIAWTYCWAMKNIKATVMGRGLFVHGVPVGCVCRGPTP